MTSPPSDWWGALGPSAEVLQPILDVAETRGERVALVGGGVRDLWLGLDFHDLDLVVEGDAIELTREVARSSGGVVRLHGSFGTATWIRVDGVAVDIASSRSEHYSRPGALPQVSAASLDDDLVRRDFSINAMALVLRERQAHLLDPHGGQEDLRRGQLRVLHPRSFIEDPCRIWRALRFASRLSLVREPETRDWMQEALQAGALQTISLQRQGAEVDYCLSKSSREDLIGRGTEWGIWAQLSSELAESGLLKELAGLPATGGRAVAWLALASALSESERGRLLGLVPGASEAQRQWTRGDSAVRRCLVSTHLQESASRASAVGRLLEGLSEPELELLRWRGSENVVRWVDWWSAAGVEIRSSIDGSRLLELGSPPGPAIGRGKAAALDAARDGESDSVQLDWALRAAESG